MTEVGISMREFLTAYGHNATLRALKKHSGRTVWVTCELTGVLGGLRHRYRPIVYRVFIDVGSLHSSVIPDVFVLYPTALNVKHINIFMPKHCFNRNEKLPKLCWGWDNPVSWSKNPDRRTLSEVLRLAKHILEHENDKSPARPRA